MYKRIFTDDNRYKTCKHVFPAEFNLKHHSFLWDGTPVIEYGSTCTICNHGYLMLTVKQPKYTDKKITEFCNNLKNGNKDANKNNDKFVNELFEVRLIPLDRLLKLF